MGDKHKPMRKKQVKPKNAEPVTPDPNAPPIPPKKTQKPVHK